MPLSNMVLFLLLSTTAFCLLLTGCAAPAPGAAYGLRENEPQLGSNIKRYTVLGSKIAINKRYDALSPDEKEFINQYYQKMGPGDEPPFPDEGLKPVYEAFSKGQVQLQVSGDLILLATVNAIGDVTQVKAIGSPSVEMTKFGSSVLLLTKFKPGLCQGKPCAMDFPFAFSFRR
jgi:hypothetical protein